MFAIRSLVCVLLPLIIARTPLAAEFASTPSLGNPSAEVRRGERLVARGGCHDCHTPFKVSPEDTLVPDMSRMLSGHPERFEVPRSSRLPKLWGLVAASVRTTVTDPWGTRFAANLTQDRETGLGDWTEQRFIDAMRTDEHRGRAGPLPPSVHVAQHSDSELEEIWAYLHSLPAVRNRVPAALPPPGAARDEVSCSPDAPAER